MKDERILRVLEFVNMLEQQERQDQENVSQKVFDKADAINTETQGSAENIQLTQSLASQQAPMSNGLEEGAI